MSTRMHPDDRYARILAAAVKLAEKNHYCQITREQIATEARCAPSLVSSYFCNMDNLRKRLMHAAVKAGNTTIVMQGLTCSDPIARKAPLVLRKKAAALLNV